MFVRTVVSKIKFHFRPYNEYKILQFRVCAHARSKVTPVLEREWKWTLCGPPSLSVTSKAPLSTHFFSRLLPLPHLHNKIVTAASHRRRVILVSKSQTVSNYRAIANSQSRDESACAHFLKIAVFHSTPLSVALKLLR